MLIDYVIASTMGVVGMVGLLQLGAEVTTLHQQSIELSLAESVLRELSVLADFVGVGAVVSLQVCTDSIVSAFGDTCQMLMEWLALLPEYQIDESPGGGLELSWRRPGEDVVSLRAKVRPL